MLFLTILYFFTPETLSYGMRMLIEELNKRPLLRPLLVWIAGIVAAVYVAHTQWLSGLLLATNLLLLLISCLGKGRESYAGRWLWGVVFLSLCFCLSLLYTVFRLSLPPYPSFGWQDGAAQLQASLAGTFGDLELPEKETSVLSTLVLGYRQSMSPELTERFSAAGVVHILSVSGFHVAALYALLSWIFSFFGRGLLVRSLDAGATLLLVWGFTVISGLDTPTVRSALMITFYSLGRAFRWQGDSYNTWAASAWLMLAYNPFYLFDIGFQLSYLAVWSILFFYPRFRRALDVRNPLFAAPWNGLMLTLAAQVGTLPLCLYYFREVSWVFLFTSLPVSWLSTLMIPLGLLWALLDFFQLPCGWLQAPLEHCVRGLIFWVEGFGEVPMLRFQFRGWMLLASYLALLFGMYSLLKRNKNSWFVH